MNYAVILAGGAGTRLWPLSRRDRPKQFLRLIDDHSLLRHCADRAGAVVSREHIFVVTAEHLVAATVRELPEIPRENILAEPAPRNTASAIGLAANFLAARDRDATMLVLPADHFIQPVERFAAAAKLAIQASQEMPEALGTFGVPASAARTELGYLRMAPGPRTSIQRVEQFVEKPDRTTAAQYVSSGEYWWNCGIFAWRAEALLAEMARQLPVHYSTLQNLATHYAPAQAAWRDAWNSLSPISIDFGVMQGAQQVFAVSLDCVWRDLGSFEAIAEFWQEQDGNRVSPLAKAVQLDCRGNILFSDAEEWICTIGVEDLLLIRSGNVTLVCRKSDADRISALVQAHPEIG
ncbi:MAG: mannose-1-phosphate guanylyltransferase [Phycisphaerae bacterium]